MRPWITPRKTSPRSRPWQKRRTSPRLAWATTTTTTAPWWLGVENAVEARCWRTTATSRTTKKPRLLRRRNAKPRRLSSTRMTTISWRITKSRGFGARRRKKRGFRKRAIAAARAAPASFKNPKPCKTWNGICSAGQTTTTSHPRPWSRKRKPSRWTKATPIWKRATRRMNSPTSSSAKRGRSRGGS